MSKPQRKQRKNLVLNKESKRSSKLLAELDSNALTDLESLRSADSAKGWYMKYMDPAGSVETHRAIGEFSKIPDGLCPFSVDAEIRTIENLSCPAVPPANIGIDGKLWSLHIISYPLFRIGHIAIANTDNKIMGSDMQIQVVEFLNNLTNFKTVVLNKQWIPLPNNEGWYVFISPLPPTFDLEDDISSDSRTVSAWRMSYKSLTCELNAPSLLDQGYWVGGQYALDNRDFSLDSIGADSLGEFATWFNFWKVSIDRMDFYVTSRKLKTAANVFSDNATVENFTEFPYLSFRIHALGTDPNPSDFQATFHLAEGESIMDPVAAHQPWATSSDEIIVAFKRQDDLITIAMTSERSGANPISMTIPNHTNATGDILFWANAGLLGLVSNETPASSIPLPALTMDQVAANNPKMEQSLLKDTKGAYLVHSKFRNPVFTLTPATSYGPLQLTCPKYDQRKNHNDGSGLVDSMDKNFSTAVFIATGISQAATIVVKLYQGWEGVANVNTPFGQFGHAGLEKDCEILELADNLKSKTTGVYPGSYNFLGALSTMALGFLKNLLSSQTTSTVIKNLADKVIDKAQEKFKEKYI